jgi:hypothetical protein
LGGIEHFAELSAIEDQALDKVVGLFTPQNVRFLTIQREKLLTCDLSEAFLFIFQRIG